MANLASSDLFLPRHPLRVVPLRLPAAMEQGNRRALVLPTARGTSEVHAPGAAFDRQDAQHHDLRGLLGPVCQALPPQRGQLFV